MRKHFFDAHDIQNLLRALHFVNEEPAFGLRYIRYVLAVRYIVL